jgi:hypothetical protein
VHSTFRFSASFIDTEDEVHSSFSDVLNCLQHLLSEQSTNAPENEMNNQNGESNNLITPAFIKATIQWMKEDADDADEDNLKEFGKKITRFRQQLKDLRPLPSSKTIPILRELGVSHSRAETKAAKGSTSQITNWVKSIEQYLACKKKEADAKYFFPYSTILSAKEVENELIRRIGMEAIKTGTVPGPHSKPSKKIEHVATLDYLDEHPELTSTGERRIDEDGDLFHAIINGAVSTAFLKPQTGIDKRETRRGHQCKKPYLRQYYKDSREGKVPNTFLCDISD